MPDNKLILIGLGNKGEEHRFHRHNIGFVIIDAIQVSYKFSEFKEKNKMLISEGYIGGKKVFLCKPKSFINSSGLIIKNTLSYLNIKSVKIIIFHDDLRIKFRKVRIKENGESGGHNGIKDINSHVTQDYLKVKIGIGEPHNHNEIKSYVLKSFPKKQCYELSIIIQKILRYIPLIADDDTNIFINRINEFRTKIYVK